MSIDARASSALFRVGQLVQPRAWLTSGCELYNVPIPASMDPLACWVTGIVPVGGVALLLAVLRADRGNIYLLGPHGAGWTFGAYFSPVE